MTEPKPIPDLAVFARLETRCSRCDHTVWFDDAWMGQQWRCDHCRITWTPDGTGGTQT